MNEKIQQIVSQEAQRHGDDILAATNAAVSRVRKLSTFPEFVDDLVYAAIRGMIGDFRHHANVAMRREIGTSGGPPKVKPGDAANRVAADCYVYFIAGRMLGSIRGDELPEIGNAEAERAEGHQFNARLCEELAKLVPAEKTVRQAVKPGKLRSVFATLQKEKEDRDAA